MIVSKPFSILHYNFTTQEYNIGFSVEKVGSLKLVQGGWEEINNEEVVRYSICDSHLKPISVSKLLSYILGICAFAKAWSLQSNMAQLILLSQGQNLKIQIESLRKEGFN